MSSLKFKNPETGEWEKIRVGGSASLPVKVNILETICEDITLNDENPSYTLPAEITLEEGALYYLDYKAYTADGTYSEDGSNYTFSKVVDGKVQWLGIEWDWGALTLTSTDIADTWREDGTTAIISIHKVSIDKTDMLLLEAINKEGYDTLASGADAHAEGWGTAATGASSHAEGASTIASGEVSHAEGGWCYAEGTYSHAEGNGTVASGNRSHTEGWDTRATGEASHAEGASTIAASWAQHVQGQYNVEDADGKYLHIVGNGNDEERHNAHTLDWHGNAWFAGDVTDGSGNVLSSHASQHSAGGSDPITPAAIGAVALKASYYIESNTTFDLDTATDSLMLIGRTISKSCPINANFIYVRQLFYDDVAANANRLQIAYPYVGSNAIVSPNCMAIRGMGGGVWSDWKQLATTDYALNKAGDTMTGDLSIRGNGVFSGWSTCTQVISNTVAGDNTNQRVLGIHHSGNTTLDSAVRLTDKIDGNISHYKLFGEHNKPSGSYTGNGDDAERVLDENQIGGIGRCLLVTSTQGICIVTTNGALIARVGSGVVEAVYSSKVSFYNGTLTLKTNDSALNGVASDGSGLTYAYQVL